MVKKNNCGPPVLYNMEQRDTLTRELNFLTVLQLLYGKNGYPARKKTKKNCKKYNSKNTLYLIKKSKYSYNIRVHCFIRMIF